MEPAFTALVFFFKNFKKKLHFRFASKLSNHVWTLDFRCALTYHCVYGSIGRNAALGTHFDNLTPRIVPRRRRLCRLALVRQERRNLATARNALALHVIWLFFGALDAAANA